MRLFFILFDIVMTIIFLLFGIVFYKSNGKAVNYLSGYNMKSSKERKKYDENQICKNYGKRMMYWAIPFAIGAVLDLRFTGIGNLIAWTMWVIMFILLLGERHKQEW